MKTSNLSADNFQKVLGLDGLTPEPAIRSSDTGQRIPCFDSCQSDHNIDVQLASFWVPRVVRKCESKHWLSSGADGRTGSGRAVYGHVITKFSGMGRFTQLWGSAHACASRARRAPLKLSTFDRTIDPKNRNVSTSSLQSIVDSILKPITAKKVTFSH